MRTTLKRNIFVFLFVFFFFVKFRAKLSTVEGLDDFGGLVIMSLMAESSMLSDKIWKIVQDTASDVPEYLTILENVKKGQGLSKS